MQVQNFTSSRFNKFNILQVPDLTISRFNKVKILQVYKAQNFTSLQAYKLTSLQAYKFTSSHVKVSISCSPNDFVKMHNHKFTSFQVTSLQVTSLQVTILQVTSLQVYKFTSLQVNKHKSYLQIETFVRVFSQPGVP